MHLCFKSSLSNSLLKWMVTLSPSLAGKVVSKPCSCQLPNLVVSKQTRSQLKSFGSKIQSYLLLVRHVRWSVVCEVSQYPTQVQASMSVDLLPFQTRWGVTMPYLGRSQLRLPIKEIRSASNNNGQERTVQKSTTVRRDLMCQLKVKAWNCTLKSLRFQV